MRGWDSAENFDLDTSFTVEMPQKLRIGVDAAIRRVEEILSRGTNGDAQWKTSDSVDWRRPCISA
jgi:hypothetical protein